MFQVAKRKWYVEYYKYSSENHYHVTTDRKQKLGATQQHDIIFSLKNSTRYQCEIFFSLFEQDSVDVDVGQFEGYNFLTNCSYIRKKIRYLGVSYLYYYLIFECNDISLLKKCLC